MDGSRSFRPGEAGRKKGLLFQNRPDAPGAAISDRKPPARGNPWMNDFATLLPLSVKNLEFSIEHFDCNVVER